MKTIFNLMGSGSVYILLFFYTAKSHAATLCPPGFDSLCKLDPDSNPDGISNATSGFISVIIILAIVLSLIYLVFGGIKWITSGGDKQKVDSARSHITAAIIGLVIALLAYAIVYILLGVFGIDKGDLKLPKLV